MPGYITMLPPVFDQLQSTSWYSKLNYVNGGDVAGARPSSPDVGQSGYCPSSSSLGRQEGFVFGGGDGRDFLSLVDCR